MLSYIRSDVMPPLSETEFNHGVALVNSYFLSRGITSFQDATVVNDYGRWQVYKRLTDNNILHSRLYFMPGLDNISRFHEAGMNFGYGDNRLRLGGVKIMLTESSGTLHPEQPELDRQVLDIDRAGFQVAIHAEEPGTVEAAVTALEYIKNQSSAMANRRHRIEHCSECPPYLMERLKVLKPVIVTQPPFLYYSGERYLATMSAEQIQWLFRTGSWFENGLIVAGSSDTPVVPANPLDGLYAAITRKAQSGQQIMPEECVSAGQALAMYTNNAAYASFEEYTKGSIMPGKLADMVLLSHDPTTVLPESIKDIKVEMTIIGGEIVWEG
jgi:predicted amidohydrolase YtcJ